MVETPQNRTKSAGCFLDNGPLISIVVPVYNMEKYLERCVDSILEQTYRNLEIILVDDCSSDTSATLIQKYVEQDDRIKVARHEVNRGLFQARITGSQIARGKYIAFVDSDDYVSIDWFRTLLKKAEAENADITVGEWCFDTDGKSRSYINLDPFRIQDYCLEGKDILKAFMEQEGTCFSWTVVWNKLYRMELWQKCLPDFIKFSEEHGHMLMWEDIAFSSGLWSNAQKVVNVHGIYYCSCGDKLTAVPRDKKNRLRYINDAAAAIEYMKHTLSRKDAIYNKQWENWKNNVACWIYQKCVIDMNSRFYKNIIRNAFNYREEFEKKKDLFGSLVTKIQPSFEWQEKIKEKIVSLETKWISFDVFDTLVQRPFSEPTDLFAILSDEFNQSTSAYVDFLELRISAEQSCRAKKKITCPSAEDVTLDEIYNELLETTQIPRERIMWLKDREQNLEVKFCEAREIGRIFFDLAVDAGKKIIICSDMYLPQNTVERILQTSGYTKYVKLYLSSELMRTKATGNLYKFVQKDLKCKNASEILHIGDNWISDVRKAHSCGWQTGHISKATDILKNYNQAIYSGEGYHRIWGRNGRQADYWETMNGFVGLRNVVGLAANRFFSNPFVSVNSQSDFNADPSYIGYFCLGTHLLAVCEWILKIGKERKIPTIHFVARDGYIIKQAFDFLNNSSIKSSYIRLSRKALMLADVNSPEDLYSLYRKVNVYQISPQKLTEYFSPIIAVQENNARSVLQHYNICFEKNFMTSIEYQKCIKVFIDHVLDFSLLPAYHAELKQYFASIIKPGDYIFDVGYSGRPEAALSNILGFPVGSLYIHVNSEMAEKRQRQYQCLNECFYSTKPCITGVMREHMMMELGPSTIGYEKVGGTLEPKLEPYEEDYASAYITRRLQQAAIEFIKDYCRTFGEFRGSIVLPLEALSAPFEYYLHDSKVFDRQIFATLPFEDSLGEGDCISALDFWNKEINNHCLATSQNTVVGLPTELSDLYLDGLFVKLYKALNKHFPKGSVGRALLKRFAGIFIH